MWSRFGKLTAGVLAGALLLAACAGEDAADTVGEDGGAFRDIVEAPPSEPASGFAEDEALAAQAVEDRKVIRDAALDLVVEDTERAFDRITTLVERVGGFVAEASLTRFETEEDAQPHIFMTLRVPADRLTSTLAEIEQLGEVQSKNLGSQDVTAEYVDIEAQLTNLSAFEVELRELLTEVRRRDDATPEDLLAVFERIRQTRDEIERLEGRQQLLDDLVDLATVRVSLTPSEATEPLVEDWEPASVVRRALRATVRALQGIVNGLIWGVLYLLPVLVVLAIPLGLVLWLVLRRRRRRTSQAGEAGAPDSQNSS